MPEYPISGGGTGGGTGTVTSVTNADGTVTVTGSPTVAPVVSRAAQTGDVLVPAGSNLAALVPQATSVRQDITSRGGSAAAGTLVNGIGAATKVTAGSNGVSLTTLAGGTALNVTAAVGPSPSGPNYINSPGQITVGTSGGLAVLGFTGTTATTYTGITIISGNGAWTVATGYSVYAAPLCLIDIYGPGDSITRGDGGTLGVTDWATTLGNIENDLAGLPQQNTGFVVPFYSDSIYGGLQWATTSGGAASTIGSPIANTNAGLGGPYASSIKLTGAGSVGDNRTFRRVILFFQNVASADKVTFATTGVVKTSVQITPSTGTGIGYWDSGDLGYNGAGTGFTATWAAGGGQGVVLIGALYIQSAGTNGVVNVNIAKGGTWSGDWAANTTQWAAFIAFLASVGFPPRRVVMGLGGNDALNGVSSATMAANLATCITAIKTASPLTEIVLYGVYNVGTLALPGVGNSAWTNSWIPSMRNVAITNGATWIDLNARFGDCSYTADPYGLTIDNLHMGTNVNSPSGRNGQQSIAELFFEKLEYSKNFQLSGVYSNGVATDGKIVQGIGVGNSLVSKQISYGLFFNANDANPGLVLLCTNANGFFPNGLYLGNAGTAPDVALVRTGSHTAALSQGVGGTGNSVLASGNNTAGLAAFATQTFVSGTAAQLAQLVEDAELTCYLTTAGTVTMAIGPTNATANTVINAQAMAIGQMITKRIPAGWWVKFTLTTAVLSTANLQLC